MAQILVCILVYLELGVPHTFKFYLFNSNFLNEQKYDLNYLPLALGGRVDGVYLDV